MAKNMFKEGNTITVTAGATIVAGRLYLLGDHIGIALNGGVSGTPIVYDISGKVWLLGKAASEAWTVGAKLYWDATNFVLTTTASGNTLVANAYAAAASADVTGYAKLRAHLA